MACSKYKSLIDKNDECKQNQIWTKFIAVICVLKQRYIRQGKKVRYPQLIPDALGLGGKL